jgi:CBS-domain-containing membrane protein
VTYGRVLKSRMVEKNPRQVRVEDVMVTCPKTLLQDCTVEQVRSFFSDDHVHMALVVDPAGRLLSTLERSDIPEGAPPAAQAVAYGVTRNRTIAPGVPVEAGIAALQAAGRRRLAVVDDDGTLLGLLCLKRSGLGFCSDAGVAARAAERQYQQPSGAPFACG